MGHYYDKEQLTRTYADMQVVALVTNLWEKRVIVRSK